MRPRSATRQGHRSLIALLCGVTLSSTVLAQLGASVALDSDYRYRGVTLSGSHPSERLTLNYDAADGAYAGASLSRATLLPGQRYAQIAGYGGWVWPVGRAVGLELGATGSHFAGARGYDYAEAYLGLLSDRWSVRLHAGPDYFGRGATTLYAEANAHLPLRDEVRLFGHVGFISALRGADADARRSRADLRLGVGYAPGRFDLQIARVQVTRGGPYPFAYDGRLGAWTASAVVSF